MGDSQSGVEVHVDHQPVSGNHDGLILNEDRQDEISPILSAINNPNIKLYKKSGVYSTGKKGFNWCVFNKKPYVNEVRKYLNKIKKFEENNVPVSFPCDMFKILGVDITEKDYLNYFRKIGKKIETNN